MKIQGEIMADLEVRSVKLYGESNTRMATIVLKVKAKADEAKEKFGADFHRVCFGSMTVKDGLASFPCEVLTKPNLTLEVHEVEILGHKVRVSPELPKITFAKDSPEATLDLVLSLPCDAPQKAMIGDIAINAGETIRANFQPIQMDLPMAEPARIKKKDGAYGNQKPMLV